jgi:hypothetical protein
MHKYKYLLNVLFLALMSSSCEASTTNNQNEDLMLQADPSNDSLKIVANYFLTHDVYINSYVVSDRDIEETHQEKRSWVKKYFPSILKKYDLTLYSQFSLASYLYLAGEKSYLQELWNTHKRLAGNKKKNIEPNEDFKPILNLLESLKVPTVFK